MADEFSKIIHENMDKGFQIRLTASTFRDIQYLHIRKYFLSYEGEWCPSQEGVSMPMQLDNVFNLSDGLIELCAKAESLDAIITHFQTRLDSIQKHE